MSETDLKCDRLACCFSALASVGLPDFTGGLHHKMLVGGEYPSINIPFDLIPSLRIGKVPVALGILREVTSRRICDTALREVFFESHLFDLPHEATSCEGFGEGLIQILTIAAALLTNGVKPCR